MKKLILLLIFTTLLNAEVLHLSIGANPSRFNPLLATDSASSTINAWLFGSLLTYDKNAQVVGELASTFEFITPTLLELRLRENLLWSDGAPLTSKDVLFTYETIISPNIHTPYASDFKHIKEVKIIDELTLHVEYKYPYFKALQMWMMGLLPYHKLKDEQNLMTSSFNQNPVGSGMYKLKTYELSKNIELEVNPNYFHSEPNIKKMIFHFLPDKSTEFMMLKSQKLDLSSITPLQLERQLDDKFRSFYEVYESVSHTYTYLGFNLANEKFKDKKVREALTLGIDSQQIVDILLFGRGEVCTGPFLPKTNAFNSHVKPPNYNPQKAKEILKSLGFDEHNPFEFSVTTSTGSRVQVAQIMQYQLEKIGVKMSIKVMEWQAFLNTVIAPRNFESVLLGWSLGLQSDAYSIWHSDGISKGGFNFVGYNNPHVDRLIIEAQSQIDSEKFGEIYQEIFRLIIEDYPYIFLFIPHTQNAINKKISPIEPSIIGVMHNLHEWTKINE